MRFFLIPFVAGAVWLIGASSEVRAEDAPPVRTRTVTVGGTLRLRMTPPQPIKTAINERETVARVLPVEGDPTSVLVVGLEPGRTRITLIGVNGKKEVRRIGQ